MPRFVIDGPGEKSRVFELCGNRPVSIGRAKSSNIVLEHESISRLHAIVRVAEEGRWQIVDRDSVNGIKLNGTLVKEATLRPNDELVVGEYRLRFEEPQVHGILAHDTVRLPQRFVRELTGSPYSGSLLPVTTGGSDADPGVNASRKSAPANSLSRARKRAAYSAASSEPGSCRSQHGGGHRSTRS
jgi:pSer/pThr/pTyr-binding forkhead associated (FHA) protein